MKTKKLIQALIYLIFVVAKLNNLRKPYSENVPTQIHDFEKLVSIIQIVKLSNCQVTKLSGYQIVRLPNCQVTKLSGYQIVRLPNCWLPNCWLPNCPADDE